MRGMVFLAESQSAKKRSRRKRSLEKKNDCAVNSITRDSSPVPLVLCRSMASLLPMVVFLLNMF